MKFIYNGQELSARLEVVNREWAVYSGEETVIGAYDGKPLYRKKIQTISPSVAGDTQVIAEYPDGVSPSNVVSLTGFLFQSDVLLQPINLYAVDNYIFTVPFAAGISMYVTAPFRNKKVVLTLEYTKTTDPEGTVQAIPTNYVHSYDTEDGWHVRKYSDGYVEMTRTVDCSPNSITFQTVNGFSGRIANLPNTAMPYPIALVECYTSEALLYGGGNGVMLSDGSGAATDRLTTTRKVNLWSIIDDNSNPHPYSFQIMFRVTGRWK